MKYLYDNGFTVLTMADLGYDENTNRIYINYLGPPTTTQTGPEPDSDNNAAEDDMVLEESDNDADIGFYNSGQDYEGDSNEFSESSTGQNEENDDGSGE
jgi:hypothetical protein